MTDHSEEIAREISALYLAVEHRLARRQQSGPQRQLEKLSLHVLGRLETGGPMRPSALAHLVRLDLSTVSRHLSALEAAGLLVREADPGDRRACLVGTTPAGAGALALQRERRGRTMGRVLADWSPADRADLVRLLSRLNADVAAHLDEPDPGPDTESHSEPHTALTSGRAPETDTAPDEAHLVPSAAAPDGKSA